MSEPLVLLPLPKLIEILASLPPEARVGVSGNGSLVIVDPFGGITGSVDFREGLIDLQS